MDNSRVYENLNSIAHDSGIPAALDFLEHHFRRDKQYFQLFEVLKMRCRLQLGLPLIYLQQPDNLNQEQQRNLEEGLVSACREIGTLLIKNGQAQEGWMYLQPVGDQQLNDKLIRSIPLTSDNMDTVIEIALNQGAAPTYGFELLLKQLGTCNAITAFDTHAIQAPLPARKEMSALLVRHLYDELSDSLRYAVRETGEEVSDEMGVGAILLAHPTLTEGGAHHIDTTHLASVMRIGRTTSSPEDLRKALELARYGEMLDEELKYPGAAPFEDTYPDHILYYSALLGEQEDTAVAHFQKKAQTLGTDEYGPIAIENLVDLLYRMGRQEAAMDVLAQEMIGQHESLGLAPAPFEIATTPELTEKLKTIYQSQGDFLGYAIALLNGLSR